jgi:hypothetical protein
MQTRPPDSLRLIRIFDARLLGDVRQGATSLLKLLTCVGKTLETVLKLGNVCIVRTVPSHANCESEKVVECAYPLKRNAANDKAYCNQLEVLLTTVGVLKRKIPIYLPDGRQPDRFSEWIVLVEPIIEEFEPEHVQALLSHVVDVIAQLLKLNITKEASDAAQTLLASQGFQRRAADNYLAYGLIRHASSLLNAWDSQISFWRISRTVGKLELVARRPGGVGVLPETRWASADAFISSMCPANPRKRMGPSSVSAFDIGCSVVSSSLIPDEGLLAQIGLLENLLLSDASHYSHGTIATHTFEIANTPDGVRTKSLLYCRKEIPGEQLALLKQSLRELCYSANIQPDCITLVIPFASAVPPMQTENILQNLADFVGSQPGKLHQLRFCGCLILTLPREAFCCLRLLELVLCARFVCSTLDAFSKQRLQFHIFARVVEMINAAANREAIYEACEFAATQLFDSTVVIEWDNNSSSVLPRYKSKALKRCRLEKKSGDALPPVRSTEFFNYKLPLSSDSWVNIIHQALSGPDLRESESDTSNPVGISGFALIVGSALQSSTIYFIRPRTSRDKAIELTFARTLAGQITQAYSRIGNPGTFELPDSKNNILHLADNPWSKGNQEGTFDPIAQVATYPGVKGYILLHLDSDANVLTLTAGSNFNKRVFKDVKILKVDNSTFAGVCATEKLPLKGKLLSNRVRITTLSGKHRHICDVRFLGWIPRGDLIFGFPIVVARNLHAILLLSWAPVKGRGLRALLDAVKMAVNAKATQYEIEQSMQLLKLREVTSREHREMLLADPPQPLGLSTSKTNFPPELEILYSGAFRIHVSSLLAKYIKLFDWNSVVLRVADWFDEKLYRLAGAGIIGDQNAYPVTNKKGVVPYTFRSAKRNKVVSLPELSKKALKVLRFTYPKLRYRPARPGTRSEICVPLYRPSGKPFATLNFESRHVNGFKSSKWACVRLAELIENTLNIREKVYNSSVQSAIGRSATVLGRAYHELKQEFEPIRNYIREELSSKLDAHDLSRIEAFITSEKRRFSDRTIDLATRRLAEVSLSDTMDNIIRAELMRLDRTLKKSRCIVDSQRIGPDLLLRINKPLFEQCIQELLNDFIRYCFTCAGSRSVYVFHGLHSNGRWALHLGHNGNALPNNLERLLFWFPVQSTHGSTGLGLSYLGLYFQSLGFYPRASASAPPEVVKTQKECAGFRTWFSVYSQLP